VGTLCGVAPDDGFFFVSSRSRMVNATRRLFARPASVSFVSIELDGTQPLGNPPVNYDYLALGVTARQRITRGLWFGLNFVRTDRRDLHVGYNDYIKNSFGADLHLTIGTRFDFEATAFYEVYDYSTAYAFHNPDAGRKIMERTIGNVSVTLRLSRHLSLVGAATYQDVASNDTRLAYNRNQFSLSIRWEQ
jgi:hypothetical protein